MKQIYIWSILFLLSSNLSFSQVAINHDGSAANSSAGLDVNFTDKGFLLPRLTFEQRNAIQNPAEGLIIYCTNCASDASGALSIYQGGLWRIFNIDCYSPSVPSTGDHAIAVSQIIWNWGSVPIAMGYKWNTTNNYNTAIDLGNTTTYTENGLSCWTKYTRYVWAYNTCGQSLQLILTDTTTMIPFSPAPTEGNHASNPTIIGWTWNYVAGATGYKWGTTNDYNAAIDLGNGILYLEQNLSCNTAYTRYVWSYDECGNSTATTLTKSTTMSSPDSPTTGSHVPSPTQIVWNWLPVTGAAGYRWNTVNDSVNATDLGNVTSKTETGLTCNTPQNSYVWAYSNCGVSARSTLSQTTSLDPPASPTAGTHVPSSIQIIWNWNSVPGATGYKWSATNDFATAENMGTNLSKTESGLSCNTAYTRYIWAVGPCGNSTATTLSFGTSVNPASPNAGIHNPTSTQIIWNWMTVQGATGYKWNTTNNYAGAEDIGTGLSKTQTGLTCNTPYSVYVWAYNTCGYSTPVTLTQTTSINPPSPATGTHNPSAIQIVWNWNAVPGATGYKWSATNSFAGAEDMGTSLSRTESGLSCNTGYTRYVWAYNTCGNSTETTLLQTTSINPASPVAGTHGPSASQIVWNWNAVPGATGYKWSTTNNYEGAENMNTSLTRTQTGLACNTGYTTYVWAYNSCGYSTATTLTQNTSVSPASPSAATHVPTSTHIIWNWVAVPGATGYKFNLTNDYSGAEDMGTNLSRTQTGLTCNTGYTAYVWSYNTCGNSAATILTQTTSINPTSAAAGTHNPTSTQIVWNWNTAPDAIGYKWSATDNYAGAEDMGNSLTKTQAGLSCNTGYTSYLWTYNSCGHSASTALTQTTSVNPAPPTAGMHVPATIQIVWNWNVVAGATGYRWSTTNDFAGAEDLSTGLTKTETGLSCNTGYTRYIWAYNACGHSTATSLTQTTSINPLAPSAATHVPSPLQIVWNWNAVTGATGYKWSLSNDYAGAEDMGSSLAKTESGLSCNQAYVRYIWSYNTCGHSTATILNQNTTINPASPSATTHVPSTIQIVWNWNASSGATGYKWNTTNNYATATDLGNTLTKTQTGLNCNTGYTTYVWAFNACGNSSVTTLTQTTTANPQAPTSATNFPSHNQIIWNWNAVPGATGYKWSTTNNYTGAQDMGTNLTKTETGLNCNTSYTRYVWAYNTCGNSIVSNLTESCTIYPPPPAAGTHVPATTQIVWNWLAVQGAIGYKWNTTNNFTTAQDMGTGLTKTQTGLTCNTGYTTYVWAYNTCGNSAVTALTQSTSINPSTPAAGTHTPSSNQIIWNWNAANGATGYRWSSVNNFSGADELGTALSKTETSLSCNTSYTRFVWAYNSCGQSTALTLTQSTSQIPFSSPPAEASHIATSSSVEWKWHPVNGATGYKWNTSNDYSSAMQMGTDTVKLETGLGCSVNLTRYVWAYDNCGNSTPTTLTKSTTNAPPVSPVAGTHVPSSVQIVWNWNAVPGASGYVWNTSNDYGSAMDMGSSTSKIESGLNCNTSYTRYVWAYNNCGGSTSTVLSQTTGDDIPDVPTAGNHVALLTEIVWNWNITPEAIGYKWNTVNDYNSATDMFTATSKTENGLTCGANYTRYVWAYNGCGQSTALTLTKSTEVCWTCGNSLTIIHETGSVCPVDKTVTYGTVTNIPGETNHCWITSNLGADNQATAVDDATEASAGWYWQFNRTQGFKHDGTTRTPNSTWIFVDETSNWTLANDPCAIELGTGWRVPTSAEWTNVDATSGWTNWNGPWNSALKLHAAGNLYSGTGALQNRGIKGQYWSSSASLSSIGYALTFFSSSSSVTTPSKSMGYSLRCIHD
jgi:hypothetical protein